MAKSHTTVNVLLTTAIIIIHYHELLPTEHALPPTPRR